MIVTQFGDVETAVKRWLSGGEVAALVQRNALPMIFLAMPKGSPVPSVILSLIGGGPIRADLPETLYRMSFDCWGTTRDEAGAIARTVVAELESLSLTGGYVEPTTGVYLGAAQVIMHRWQPDPDSDTPRYIVDALITTVT